MILILYRKGSQVHYNNYRCEDIAAKFFKDKNGESQQIIHAIAHCHIDSGKNASIIKEQYSRNWLSPIDLRNDSPLVIR